MKRTRGQDSRGTVTLFVILSLSFMLAMGGIAIDLAQFTAVQGELQRSVDAAALAGAGGLRFGSYAFGAAQGEAKAFGDLNPHRGGPVTLAPTDITVGIYSDGTFRAPGGAAALPGESLMVNAVRATYETTTPASFLRILGFTDLTVAAQAIAVASPPLTPPPNTCLLPIGLSRCAFEVPGEGGNPANPNTSNGCGRLVKFVVTGAAPAGSPVTAAWVDRLPGATAEATMGLRVLRAINNVANGLACADPLAVGDPENPLQRPVDNTLPGATQVMAGPLPHGSPPYNYTFIQAFNTRRASLNEPVTDSAGNPVHEGPAWVAYVPVIDTDCANPTAPIEGNRTIVGWAQFAVTAINDQGLVYGSLPPGERPTVGMRTIYGYYQCPIYDAPYNPRVGTADAPVPISALSQRLRLVK